METSQYPAGGKRVMALDLGKARIGVAVSDALGLTAQPLETIRTKSRQEAQGLIRKTARRMDVGTIVVGMPYNMDGTEGEQAQWARRFGEQLEERMKNVEIVYWDERLTSVASESILIESGMKSPKRKQHRDQVAAALILEAYLESRRYQSSE